MQTIAIAPSRKKKPLRDKKSSSARSLSSKPKLSLRARPNNDAGRYVTIYLSSSLASHYEEKAALLKTTVGKLLKQHIETKPVTVFDRMKKFIGSAGDGPADLSTNPIYLEGMGEDIIPIKFKK